MSATTTTHVALCATCRVSPEPVTEDHAGKWRCPSCGATDTRDGIHKELAAHAVAQAERRLNEALRKAAQSSKFITYKPGTPPRSNFRWITDFRA